MPYYIMTASRSTNKKYSIMNYTEYHYHLDSMVENIPSLIYTLPARNRYGIVTDTCQIETIIGLN